MAIDNIFYFNANNDSREEIGRKIMNNIDRAWKVVDKSERYAVYNDCISISISVLADRINQTPNSEPSHVYRFGRLNEMHGIEGYRFSATHELFINWRKTDLQQFIYDETRIMNFLLNEYQGDAVYMVNVESPRLWRRNGQLYLSTRGDNAWFTAWDQPLANLFTLPFEMEEMPYAV